MIRAVVFHHDRDVREQLVDAFRHAGFITYNAIDPQRAYQAVWTYRPQVVITEFPALLDETRADGPTLTEAIRRAPALRGVAIVNLSDNPDEATARHASEAGVTRSIPPSTPVAEVIATVQQVSRQTDRYRT